MGIDTQISTNTHNGKTEPLQTTLKPFVVVCSCFSVQSTIGGLEPCSFPDSFFWWLLMPKRSNFSSKTTKSDTLKK